jgi:2-amino-4-hydroxy-6-hydroxymethyldihydropteridine diphosphokinase
MTTRLHHAYVSLGTNLGDRAANLREALRRLARLPGTHVVTASAMLETPPWGYTEQPNFLNMAVELSTTLSPEGLLAGRQAIEDSMGRRRIEHWGPRIIDIDLLVYPGEQRDTPALRLPHPFLTQRRFVLEPLAEIAPELEIHGKTVQEWLRELAE